MRVFTVASSAGCGVRATHGEVVAGRTVSFLELFYDLVNRFLRADASGE